MTLQSNLNHPYPELYADPRGVPQPESLPLAAEESSAGEEGLSYFYRGRTVSVLLLGFLYLLLAVSLDAAGWVDNMSLLIPVTLGAMAMGSLMAFSRFDGLFMISHSLSTGLAWVFFLMTRMVDKEPRVALFQEHGVSELQARAYFLLERWLEWVQNALSGAASNDNYVFILEISFLLWWLTYLGAWTVLRHGFVWRGVILAGVALMVNTYYAPQPVTGIMVVFFVVAILLLSWTNLVSHQQRWQALRIRFNQDLTFDFVRDGIFYALVVISLAFLAPNLGRSLTFNQLMQPINERWESATTEWNRLYQGINRQTRLNQAGFGRTLTLGGERNLTPQPVLQIQATSGRYWRAVTYDSFTGRQWINTAEIERSYAAGEVIDNPGWASRRAISQTVRLLAPMGQVVVAAADVQLLSLPVEGLRSPLLAETTGNGEIAPGTSELIWARSRIPLEEGDSYVVVSSATQVTERELREASLNYPDLILQRYLQLPDQLAPDVVALAQEVAGSQPTVYDQAKALEGFLRTFTYDEAIPAPGPNQDPVTYFLFDIQRGYCDYYATSMVVMLRSLGIPSRVASGYNEGEYDRESDSFIITEQDAHSWVEVYFPAYGWIEFEPTAGVSSLERPSGIQPDGERDGGEQDRGVPERDDLPMMDDGFPDMPQSPQEMGELEPPPFFGEGGTIDMEAPSTWIGFSVILTLAALAGGWWLMRRRTYAGPSDFEAAPVNRFYQRLNGWTERLGWQGLPGQTPYERAALLGERLPVGRDLIQRLTDLYVHYRYAPTQGQTLHQSDEPAQIWQRLRPIFWKAWVRGKVGRKKEE